MRRILEIAIPDSAQIKLNSYMHLRGFRCLSKKNAKYAAEFSHTVILDGAGNAENSFASTVWFQKFPQATLKGCCA
jgi:hypothetical protein